MAQWQRVGFQTRRLGVRIPLPSLLFFFLYVILYNICELGLVGYDGCLTRSRSWVRFPELVFFIFYKKKKGTTGIEPVTAGSAIPCSTTELRTLFFLFLKKKKIYNTPTVTGLEPATAGFEVQRAIHCATRSYIYIFKNNTKKSRWRESNSRPSPYKGDAITTMLHRLANCLEWDSNPRLRREWNLSPPP